MSSKSVQFQFRMISGETVLAELTIADVSAYDFLQILSGLLSQVPLPPEPAVAPSESLPRDWTHIRPSAEPISPVDYTRVRELKLSADNRVGRQKSTGTVVSFGSLEQSIILEESTDDDE